MEDEDDVVMPRRGRLKQAISSSDNDNTPKQQASSGKPSTKKVKSKQIGLDAWIKRGSLTPKADTEKIKPKEECDPNIFFGTSASSASHETSGKKSMYFDEEAPKVDWSKAVKIGKKKEVSSPKTVEPPPERQKRSAESLKVETISPSTKSKENEDEHPPSQETPIKKKRKLPGTVNLSQDSAATGKTSSKKSSKTNDTVKLPTGLPLDEIKIVFTGVFDEVDREALEEEAKRLGAHVTSAVSGKTDFLVVGSKLEDGRDVTDGNKHKKASSIIQSGKGRIKIITEEEFLDMTRAKKGEDCEMEEGDDASQETADSPQSNQKPSQSSQMKKSSSFVCTTSGETKKHHTLWCEKYRPQTQDDLVGNLSLVNNLRTWLKDWRDVCLLGKKKEPSKGFRGRNSQPENINARAALISGPPGIGKTTSALIATRESGYEALEFNASDARGKSIVDVISDMTSGGYTLSKSEKKNPCLIMDECDGLAGGDRGGSPAIIKLIEKTKCPVICICNDRMHPKVRSIANKCYDLRYTRPPKSAIAKQICQIARRENVIVEPNAVELLCESVGNDLRLLLNTLQFMAAGHSKITYDIMKSEIGYGLKDAQVMLNPFNVAKKVLSSSEGKSMSIDDKLDAFFVDFDLMPLLIHENILAAVENNPDPAIFQRVATAEDDFAFADTINRLIRGNGNWGLLPELGVFTLVDPSDKCNGFLAWPTFPTWLGRNSTTNKAKRMLADLQLYLSAVTTATPLQMRVSGYLDAIYNKIMQPLLDIDDPKDASDASIKLMDEYGLTREHVVENIAQFRLKSQDTLYDIVDKRTKMALTRTYNTTSHPIKMAPISRKPVKGSAAATSMASMSADADGTAPLKDDVDLEDGNDDEKETQKDDAPDLLLKSKDKSVKAKRTGKESAKKSSTKKK